MQDADPDQLRFERLTAIERSLLDNVERAWRAECENAARNTTRARLLSSITTAIVGGVFAALFAVAKAGPPTPANNWWEWSIRLFFAASALAFVIWSAFELWPCFRIAIPLPSDKKVKSRQELFRKESQKIRVATNPTMASWFLLISPAQTSYISAIAELSAGDRSNAAMNIIHASDACIDLRARNTQKQLALQQSGQKMKKAIGLLAIGMSIYLFSTAALNYWDERPSVDHGTVSEHK